MKKTRIHLVSAGILVTLAVAGVNQFNSQDLALRGVSEFAHNLSPRLDDRELGIGDYGERGHSDAPRLNDKELGIGDYSEHA